MGSDRSKPTVREQPLTYDDYARLPCDGMRYELVSGSLELMAPAPTPKHQAAVSQMLSLLMETCHSDYVVLVAPVDLILSPTEVRQPDLLMVHRSRLNIITRRGIEGPPDLVVEVVSPHSIQRDTYTKLATYAHYSIPEYWVVDPLHGTLDQHILSPGGYMLRTTYQGDTPVLSDRIAWASFTMRQIMQAISQLPG